jgi:hypothetical protein
MLAFLNAARWFDRNPDHQPGDLPNIAPVPLQTRVRGAPPGTMPLNLQIEFICVN